MKLSGDHHRIERHIEKSGVAYTHLRAGELMLQRVFDVKPATFGEFAERHAAVFISGASHPTAQAR